MLHSNLFDLLWYGDGRWDWETIYHMPIPIRNFWVKKLNEKLNPTTDTNTSRKNKKTTTSDTSKKSVK